MSRRSEEHIDALFWGASYHEAGHAVCALYHGIEVGEIRVRVATGWWSGPDPSGETWCETDEHSPEGIADGIVVYHAGPEAESWWWSHYHGISIRRARRDFRAGSEGDMRLVADGLERLGADRRLAARLEREAQAVVSEVWGSIVAVAEALRECEGYLTGDQVLAAA